MTVTTALPSDELLAPLFARPWAISARHFRALQARLAGVLAHQPGAFFELADLITPRAGMVIDPDGVATISVSGALADKAPPIWGKLGNSDYRDIRTEVDAVLSERPRALTLNIDSPGGSVAGLPETAEAIAAVSEAGIPVTAHCDGLACSAAYWLASSADHISATPSAEVGNIGVVLVHADATKFLESAGIELNVLHNEGADLKGTFREPLSDSQRAFLQDDLDDLGSQFAAHVTAGRGPALDPEVFRAGWYSGQSALDLGLVDTVS